MKLSVVIITHNEAKNIARCIDSVLAIADEVVVVDSFSKDQTVQIAKEKGARVLEREFDGYIQQKNFANEAAEHEWVLSLDADECISQELQESIAVWKKEPGSPRVYEMNRLNRYGNQWIKHGGWYPDRKVRLFDKSKAAWGGRTPHETMKHQEENVGFLKGDILHYAYESFDEHWRKSKNYARMASTEQSRKSVVHLLLKCIFSPPIRFLKFYFLKGGFLDGWNGFKISYVNLVETYWKYTFSLQKKFGK